jgi:GNAT superfamily N-acetyltransferase
MDSATGREVMIELRRVPAADPAVAAFLAEREMAVVARRGEVVDALARPAVTAVDGDELVGVLTYDLGPVEVEIVALYAGRQWGGIGSVLIEAVVDLATAAGCRRCWLVTTNDNVDALRFYQRRGFHLTTVRCGAVDEARRSLKRAIPLVGDYGIPLRDELELARDLVS